MYVITGVTGNTGSAAANALLAEGKQVRVVVRDAVKAEAWKSKGATAAIASIEDRAAFAAALAGATGAYILLPPSAWTATGIPAERAKQIEAIAGAIADAKPKHVVVLSSIGADKPDGTGPVKYLHDLEQAVKKTGVPATFLRAAAFQDNWSSMVKGALEQGALYHGLEANLPIPQVASQDIGKLAAKLLAEGPRGNARIVQLAGPREVTLSETAELIGKAGGKPVKAVSVPLDAMIGALAGMGASRELAAMYAEMTGAINTGHMTWTSPEVVRGSTPLETKLREYV